MVKPKKSLGQHFLTDKNIAQKIVSMLVHNSETKTDCLEIGPGKGMLTQYLLQRKNINLHLVEIDTEAVDYLNNKFNNLENPILSADILKLDLNKLSSSKLLIIGNFPYNISSQIFFKILENKNLVSQVVCMIQKEVAEDRKSVV